MDLKRRQKLIFRWSLIFTCLITLFWTAYYLVNGSVPMVTSIQMTSGWTIILPFEISRWWNVLIVGPIWFFLLVCVNNIVKDDKNLAFGLVVGLTTGLTFGLTAGLTAGLMVAPAFGPAFGLAFGVVVGLVVTLVVGLVVGLILVLAFGLTAGLVKSFQSIIFKDFWQSIGLTAGLVKSFQSIIFKDFWQSIANWLLAR